MYDGMPPLPTCQLVQPCLHTKLRTRQASMALTNSRRLSTRLRDSGRRPAQSQSPLDSDNGSTYVLVLMIGCRPKLPETPSHVMRGTRPAVVNSDTLGLHRGGRDDLKLIIRQRTTSRKSNPVIGELLFLNFLGPNFPTTNRHESAGRNRIFEQSS
ncbi:uncharacterized protein EI97DRAFT_70113 [Westerdykella ornata]|uniref:Uncharacterized protein n=1 Tax=Westerdykella ornata TaxID=318751 RepID=A0A6A6JLC0_WESOR|nr:uncharacterized protein EI97DRAFT_70113 [Westerdykella ornata]KAF2275709.1 hypothetical protein EI97DRAFT_70113 [Westerdykella ornata]